jgi:glutaredoxin
MLKDVTIFGKQKCSYCDKAKTALTEAGIPFKYVDVQDDAKALEFVKEAWSVQNKPATVPLIYTGVWFLGGYTELQEELTRG